MIRRITLVVAVFVCAVGTYAQTPPNSPPEHQNGLVSGAQYPERIPESVAYRTYFLGRATKSDDSEMTRHLNDLKLAEIGLDAWDLKALTNGLADFYLKYAALTEQHNRQAEMLEASGRHADVVNLNIAIARLVADARAQLAPTMSESGQLKLQKTIQREKHYMRISESEAQ